VDRISLTTPASEAFVPILRSMTAAVAARLEIPYDEVDDLRLAIDEAVAHLIGLEPRGSTIALEMLVSEERFEVAASVDTLPDPWPQEGIDQTLTWQILKGLTDETSFEHAGGRAQIRFVKLVQRVKA